MDGRCRVCRSLARYASWQLLFWMTHRRREELIDYVCTPCMEWGELQLRRLARR